RRRHTRSYGDWSSDVCSSDLQVSHTASSADLVGVARACGIADTRAMTTMAEVEAFAPAVQDVASGPRFASVKIDGANLERVLSKIGRASCRERVLGSCGGRSL